MDEWQVQGDSAVGAQEGSGRADLRGQTAPSTLMTPECRAQSPPLTDEQTEAWIHSATSQQIPGIHPSCSRPELSNWMLGVRKQVPSPGRGVAVQKRSRRLSPRGLCRAGRGAVPAPRGWGTRALPCWWETTAAYFHVSELGYLLSDPDRRAAHPHRPSSAWRGARAVASPALGCCAHQSGSSWLLQASGGEGLLLIMPM